MMLQRLMQHVIAALPSGGTVLDYGCGTGRACVHFHPDRYVGFDTSAAMLAIARSRFPQYTFVCALNDIRPQTGRVDVVFSNSVVQYQPPDRWEATLRDIAGRARVAALIETYDLPIAVPTMMGAAAPARREGGSGAPIWLWPIAEYVRVLESFGTVARLMLADDGPVLYTVTR